MQKNFRRCNSIWRAGHRFISAHPPSRAEITGEKPENESENISDKGAARDNQHEEKARYQGDREPEVEMLVSESLVHVRTLGWTDAAIRAAATTLEMSPAASRMIPGGASELALRFVTRCNANFAADLASSRPTDSKPAILVSTAVQKRLELISPYHHNWSSALKLMGSSRLTALEVARQSALLADEIAHYAGYRNPGTIWYTDRAALAALYHATELFWVADRTTNQSATWTFLRAYSELSVGARMRIGNAIDRLSTAQELGSSTISALMRSLSRGY